MKVITNFLCVCSLLLFLPSFPVSAQELVDNINRANASSSPRELQSNDRWAVFVADTDSLRSQLFYLKAGEDTARVFPAFIPASPLLGKNGMKLIGDTLHFGLYHEGSFTWYAADLNTGSLVALIRVTEGGPETTIDYLILLGEQLTLFITDDFSNTGLYTSDGSPAGTQKLGSFPLERGVSELIATDSLLFFLDGNEGGGSRHLWQSDGTLAGTFPINMNDEFEPATIFRYLIPYRNTFYFLATIGQVNLGRHVYKPASTGTGRVQPFRPGGEQGGRPWRLQVANDTLYCYSIETNGWTIWKTDGTEAGTKVVLDSSIVGSLDGISSFVVTPSIIYFTRSISGSPSTLWRTNGTANGTYELASFESRFILQDIIRRPLFGTSTGGLYFLARNNATGLELWYTDGNEKPTRPVADLFSGPVGAIPGDFPFSDFNQFAQFASQGDKLLFIADDGKTGNEVFISDGTEAGTKLTVDPYTQDLGSSPTSFFAFGDQLLFSANTPRTGFELFSTGDEATSAELIKDTRPGRSGGFISSPIVFQDRTFYINRSDSYPYGSEVWRTDGTEEGTEMFPTFVDSMPFSVTNMSPLGDQLLIRGHLPDTGITLFTTNGDPDDIEIIKTFRPGYSLAGEKFFHSLNDSIILFIEEDPLRRRKLWRTDGTESGTFVVEDLSSGFNDLSEILINDGLAYFSLEIGDIPGVALVSDGTAEGTHELIPRGPFRGGLTNTTRFIGYGDLVYFDGKFGTTAEGLFSINPAGEVRQVLRNDQRLGFNSIDNLLVTNGRLFFSIETEETGNELWVIDFPGEEAHLVADLNAGPASASPRDLTVLDNCLYFSAETAAHGRELFRTDRTARGTVLVADINPGMASANVQHIYAFKGSLYFSADDGVFGPELWRYTPDPDDDSCIIERVVSAHNTATTPFNFTIYPNPASEEVHLKLPTGNYQVTLISNDGKQVKELTSSGGDFEMAVGNLPRGLYMLHVVNPDSGARSVKPIVLH